MNRGEGGFTMIELLVTMAILGTVMSGVSILFVAALRGESDTNRRFAAEQQLAVALNTMRRQIHSACVQTTLTSITGPAASLTIDMPNPSCTDASGAATTQQVTWCVRSIATGRYGLYTVNGNSCTGGRLAADYITSSTPFTFYPANVTANAPSGCNCKALARIHVDMTVQMPSGRGGSYRALDDIAFRNSRI